MTVDAQRVVAIMEELTEKLTYLSVATRQDVMVKRMKMTVEEERARKELLERYIQQEKAASSRRTELEKQLTLLRTEREKASNRSCETVVKLKADLQDVHDFTEQRLAQLHEQYRKREAEHTRNFDVRASELVARMNQQQKHNSMVFSRGKQETDTLKSKTKIAEKDLERIIETYDREMMEKNAKAREVAEANATKEELVVNLQKQLQVINEENDRIRQEYEIEKVRQSIIDRQLQRLAAAATLLQAYWRGIRQREEYVAMKKNARNKRGWKGKKN
ncbi:putative coiled-coil protein [Toxoplasma gondii VAND]|uniref:Dynein regulatory complex protein 10 n=3 Tax=Toxoplasma gondii TaxID=5811 RepID=A0A2G8Y1L4_TOXGO|nr:putative coiled-coil protein [Toxoplasma gondii VAND]KFH16675.1 putative coiled-coil protein [Toxoplasma gondii MAS]PIM01165.1 putative coiled-coil protein [Toxoplasma gondii COUG]